MRSDIGIISPSGILDGTQAEEFRQAVDDAIDDNAEAILIDLEKVTFVDSSGLGILVVVLKKVRAANKDMYFCSINEQVRMLFELTSMDQVFKVVPNRAAFEEKFGSLSKA